VSAKRHAKLVDYRMHDGRNAWTYVHVRAASAGIIPASTQLVTRIASAMRFDRQPGVVPVPQPVAPPGPVLNLITDDDYRTDRALAQVRVFETTADATVDPLLDELRLHPWGNEQCCLPRGATRAPKCTSTSPAWAAGTSSCADCSQADGRPSPSCRARSRSRRLYIAVSTVMQKTG